MEDPLDRFDRNCCHVVRLSILLGDHHLTEAATRDLFDLVSIDTISAI